MRELNQIEQFSCVFVIELYGLEVKCPFLEQLFHSGDEATVSFRHGVAGATTEPLGDILARSAREL